MKRFKKHKIKREAPESSQIRNEEHDLAYYIHDRVELMHQVFSVLKHKELRAMAPECVRNISMNDLQELCTEELLGISSKRLCAILDGADPPSNTDSSSSSPEHMETISLDSISSDEEILSQSSSKKNKKHKHRHSKKHKEKKKANAEGTGDETGTASRAGLTVLELLELQARARAIRAQLQQHQTAITVAPDKLQSTSSGDDDEVVIKEEAPEVVEISSDDEKPSIEELEKKIESASKKSEENASSVTKRINNLVITVPQSKTSRKIKLNRTKSTQNEPVAQEIVEVITEVPKGPIKLPHVKETQNEKKSKKKQKKKDKQKEKDGSDHDEITLQLSDSEKMDLLEDFDRKESSEDSESSSSSSSDEESAEEQSKENGVDKNKDSTENDKDMEEVVEKENDIVISKMEEDKLETKEVSVEHEESNDKNKEMDVNDKATGKPDESPLEEAKTSSSKIIDETRKEDNSKEETKSDSQIDVVATSETKEDSNQKCIDAEDGEIVNKDLSDGEVSEKSAENNTNAIFCISDDEKKTKKKKKKEKKSKKSKKSDFRESADQNFYTIMSQAKSSEIIVKEDTSSEVINLDLDEKSDIKKEVQLHTDDSIDDVFEYLELSDDSSCYEVEGVSVLSKEPTAEEIAALSARIDSIKREDIVTEKEETEIKNVSWKDRYLESKKVKSVLSTANILNAIRKKNKELKKRIEETKKVTEKEEEVPVEDKDLVEGSIDQYNTLEGSTKFVDPIKPEEVSKEMEKDAKQLLKMYKKLLKFNHLKKKDPNKKKKKKKSKDGDRLKE